ncbi:MAG: hypothetical protein JSR67_11680 [Proteobacteria bacterium]|nr:hypothetical protein [Pseudomonadota bacterium]
MPELVHRVDSPGQISAAAQRLRAASRLPLSPQRAIDALERWGTALRGASVDAVPGVAFLRLWLRRGTLEPLLQRELGAEALRGGWSQEHNARLQAFPIGVVGHWPAANVEIQPILSLTCSLLGGNSALVRVPTSLVEETRALLDKLREVDGEDLLAGRIFAASFPHERLDLQQAMAAAVDGAMIWGGLEAVTQLRALPFPHWARVLAFGPRLSVAAMDAATWMSKPQRASWCQRIARDLWQFDQQACSSPQALFLERGAGGDVDEFVAALAAALRQENSLHPRRVIDPALTSAICAARANWLLEDGEHRGVFPPGPDWTVLVGSGAAIPRPTQGRTLPVLLVEDLNDPIAAFDGAVQTLGLAVADAKKEEALARAAGLNGVDRVVKLGRMHVFGSPWDGVDLVRPMMRLVRHMPSHDGVEEEIVKK